MKYFIPVFLLLFAISARAQITLEHTYPSDVYVGLLEVDSGEWKYVQPHGSDSINIYNIDHSLDRVIRVQYFNSSVSGFTLEVLAKGLFDSDTDYAYLVAVTDTPFTFSGLRIFKENGTLLFSCDTCQLDCNGYNGFVNQPPPAIKSTADGTKIIIEQLLLSGTLEGYKVEVYSLPGKLPNCNTALASVTPSIAYTNPSLPTSAYPNPSTGHVRIAYQLPPGVSSGEVILTREDGTEVKRYRVTSAFSDLLIEESDLPSGAYFYKLVTEKGESTAERIVMMK